MDTNTLNTPANADPVKPSGNSVTPEWQKPQLTNLSMADNTCNDSNANSDGVTSS